MCNQGMIRIFRGLFFRIRWLKPLNCPFCFRSTAIAICASVGRNSLARSNCRPEIRKISIKPADAQQFGWDSYIFSGKSLTVGDNDYTYFKNLQDDDFVQKRNLPKKQDVRYETNLFHCFTMFFFPGPFLANGISEMIFVVFLVLNLKNKSWFLNLNIVADVHISMYTPCFYMCIYDVSQVKDGQFGFKWLFNLGEDE